MSIEQEMSIMSGRELQEQLLKMTNDEKRVRLLVEACIRQQQELFYLNKKMLEIVSYLDQIADTMVNVVSGTSALAAELAPFLKKTARNINNNMELTND